jgi:probable HAF family extracellular repeat protein
VDLGHRTSNPDGADVGLFGVNDQEQVVGGSGHAFLQDDETITDLGTLGGPSSVAYALNEVGQVVGSADLPSGSTRAFLWHQGVMQDLGTLGGDYSVAYDVNESGQVVGTSALASGARHAFLWENGVMSDLGALPRQNISAAHAINDAGQTVGYSRRLETDLASSIGVIWSEAGVRPLSADVRDRAPWSITDARDINNRGQIAGVGLHLGSSTGVLLTPAANDLSAAWIRASVKYRGIRAPRTTLEGDLLIRNGGDRTVGLIALKTYLSLDDQLDASDQLVNRRIISLPPAGQTTLKLRIPLTRGREVSGRRMIAVIDADQVYSEEDETNNVVVSTPLP